MFSSQLADFRTACHLVATGAMVISSFLGTTSAATRVVSSRQSSVFTSAVAASQAGDTITFALPADSETINLSKMITIAKTLTIDGANFDGSGVPVTF